MKKELSPLMKIESCIFKTPTRVDPKRAQVNLRAAQIDPEEFESTPNMGSTMTISFHTFQMASFLLQWLV